MNMVTKPIAAKRVHEIAEELRTTKYNDTGEIAFDYIWNKYKEEFGNDYDLFLRLMEIEATFFSSQGEKTAETRKNTVYKYV